jgi:hypothetical protein
VGLYKHATCEHIQRNFKENNELLPTLKDRSHHSTNKVATFSLGNVVEFQTPSKISRNTLCTLKFETQGVLPTLQTMRLQKLEENIIVKDQ